MFNAIGHAGIVPASIISSVVLLGACCNRTVLAASLLSTRLFVFLCRRPPFVPDFNWPITFPISQG